MPVFMTHKDHGATHVNSGEVEAHEKNGWKVDTYDNWMAPKRVKPANETPDDIAELRQQYAEKFGKRPHHKKTAESLRADLAE